MTIRATPTLLSVEGLRYRYRSAAEWALDGVSFSIEPGEIMLIVGASGCGKSTLFRCLNGLIPRSVRGGELEGQILIEGSDPSSLSLAALSGKIGTVLQNPEKQIVGCSVANEVAFGLENLAVPRPVMRRKVSDLLETLSISHLLERDTFYLSGGEKQKVAITGTLAMDPSVLLLDEPLSNLDPASGAEVIRLVRELAAAGKAILLIEHRLDDVLAVNPDRALLLEAGKPIYSGGVDGLIQRYSVGARHRAGRALAPAPRKPAPRKPAPRGPAPRKPAAGAAEEPGESLAPGISTGSRSGDERAVLAFEDVSFWYGGPGDGARPALASISLTVERGNVVAILGANGAGKSTLLKLGIGLLRPQSGRVLLHGRSTEAMTTAAIARDVGYVFQNPGSMFFAPTVREELAFGPRNLGHEPARVERSVQHALEALDLVSLADRSPLSLSHGQQKRASIAAVLAMESRVLLLDEPTAGQDDAHTMQFMDIIMALPHFEAVVFISHDVDLALEYADRVALLAGGNMRAAGSPLAVLSDAGALRDCRLLPTARLQDAVKAAEAKA